MFRIFKFLCTGATGVTVNLTTLFLLADIFDMHYLAASIIAICVSTVVGFLLQKYWTFEEHSRDAAGKQFTLYVAVASLNILVNTLIVFTLVDFVGLHHLLAQFIGAGVVAVSSFIIYSKVIFRITPKNVA